MVGFWDGNQGRSWVSELGPWSHFEARVWLGFEIRVEIRAGSSFRMKVRVDIQDGDRG